MRVSGSAGVDEVCVDVVVGVVVGVVVVVEWGGCPKPHTRAISTNLRSADHPCRYSTTTSRRRLKHSRERKLSYKLY